MSLNATVILFAQKTIAKWSLYFFPYQMNILRSTNLSWMSDEQDRLSTNNHEIMTMMGLWDGMNDFYSTRAD